MITVIQLTDKLKSYIVTQLDSISKTTPMVGLMKPVITRVMDKNLSKVTKALDLISDDNGNIDVENILSEMMENLVSTKSFTLNTSFIGDIEIGDGCIKLNIPLTNKKLVLNMEDLESFKEILISK